MNRLQTKRVKAPTYIQFEAAECGAASLGTILSYFGLKLDLSELRIRCGVTRDGSNMKQLLDAGRGYGLTGRGYRTNMKLLQDDIGHLKFSVTLHRYRLQNTWSGQME